MEIMGFEFLWDTNLVHRPVCLVEYISLNSLILDLSLVIVHILQL
jgi:hypothetical protein